MGRQSDRLSVHLVPCPFNSLNYDDPKVVKNKAYLAAHVGYMSKRYNTVIGHFGPPEGRAPRGL